MPEIIIEQNQNISNYVNMLQLPYSSSLQNHMLNMISVIITAEGSKNVSAIYRKLTCNRDRSCGSRFLGEYQVESLTSIKRFWSMVFMAYTFLELFRVSNGKKLKLKTI